MENSTLDKVLVDQLLSTDNNSQLHAIEIIQQNGNVHYVPVLLALYEKSKSTEVRKKITNLLNSIKDPKVAPIVIQQLQESKSEEIRSMLLTSCWSSGIDYSDYLPVFIDVILTGEYMTAFEALTIIDNIDGKFDKKVLTTYIQKVKEVSANSELHKKKAIYVELIGVLESFCLSADTSM